MITLSGIRIQTPQKRPKIQKVAVYSESQKSQIALNNAKVSSLKRMMASSPSSAPKVPHSTLYGPPGVANKTDLRCRLQSTIPKVTKFAVEEYCRIVAPRSKTGGKWFSINGGSSEPGKVIPKGVEHAKMLLRVWCQRTQMVATRVFYDIPFDSLEKEWSESWKKWNIDGYVKKEEKTWGWYHKNEIAKLQGLGLSEKQYDSIRERAKKLR